VENAAGEISEHSRASSSRNVFSAMRKFFQNRRPVVDLLEALGRDRPRRHGCDRGYSTGWEVRKWFLQ
jgi:hypothetical protein